MSDVFLSYKREDSRRAAQLVRALQSAGLTVWWDRSLPGGEAWRSHIESALDSAGCVIVAWSTHSTGPDGGFVRDEASRAQARGVLLSVLLEPVSLPLGFGEHQAIDLTHWRGAVQAPALQDLLAAVRARLAGHSAPEAKAPAHRLGRRLRQRQLALGLGAGLAALALAFATSTLGLQPAVCATAWAQPTLGDACGALNLGAAPSRAERLAWQALPTGDCAALQAHLQRFPTGTTRNQALALLAARQVTRTERWVSADTPTPLRLWVPSAPQTASTEAAARAAALARGQAKAHQLCLPLAASGLQRLREVTVQAQDWQCEALPRGVTCGFEGQALCLMDRLSASDDVRCPAAS